MLNLNLLSALIPEYDRIHEGDNRYLQLRINDFGENFNPSGRYLWVVYRVAGAKTFVSQQYDLSSMSPSSTGSNYSYTVDLKDCILVAPGKLEVQVILTNSSDNLLTLMDKYESGTTNALIIKSRVYEYYIDESLNPSEGIVSDSGGLSQTIKDYLEDLVQEVIEQGFELNIDSALSASSRNPVENRVIKDALYTKLDKASVESALSGSSVNPVQNKVIKQALDDKLGQSDLNAINAALADKLDEADVDDYLSDTSTNPVQNKVIKEALDSIPTTVVDISLSSESAHPVQNRVIKAALDAKLDASAYVVDSAVYNQSSNPVENRAVAAALSQKVNSSDLDSLVGEYLEDEGYLKNYTTTSEQFFYAPRSGYSTAYDASSTPSELNWQVVPINSSNAWAESLWHALVSADELGDVYYESNIDLQLHKLLRRKPSNGSVEYFTYGINLAPFYTSPPDVAQYPEDLFALIAPGYTPIVCVARYAVENGDDLLFLVFEENTNRPSDKYRFVGNQVVEHVYAEEAYVDTAIDNLKNGIIFEDTSTGTLYKLTVANGQLNLTATS